MDSAVKVFVRVRPLLQNESQSVVQTSPTTTTISLPYRRQSLFHSPETAVEHKKSFQFDRCFQSDQSYLTGDTKAQDKSQDELYAEIGPLVLEAAFQGYNSCVFAYGMTSSGKSYSMSGTEHNAGIIPRLCRDIFSRAADLRDCQVSFEVTFMEIYNERVRDLLHTQNKPKKGYRVREHPTEGPYVEGLTRVSVHTYDDMAKLLDSGNLQRTVASTRINATSSRSHALFTLHLCIKYTKDDVTTQKVSKISLVDLAGSERQSVSQTSGDRLKEGSNINKSLSALGMVITALVERSRLARLEKSARRKVFVPYRDSILTWLLRTSLGGNSKTIMLATISPAAEHAEESLSTLRYASRAKQIVNVAVVNEDKSSRIIKDLTDEVERLRERLAQLENASKIDSNDKVVDVLRLQLKDSQSVVALMQQQLDEQLAFKSPVFSLESPLTLTRRDSAASEDTFRSIKVPFGLQRGSNRTSPYLVSLDEDDIVDSQMFLLQKHLTYVGSEFDQDIVLNGELIESSHAVFSIDEENVIWLEPSQVEVIDDDILRNLPGAELEQQTVPVIYVNGTRLVTKTRLNHGLRILFGRSHLFRFYNPREARELKLLRKQKHLRSESFTSVDNFGYSSVSSESAFYSGTSVSALSESPSPTPQYRRHSLLQTRSYVNADLESENGQDELNESQYFESNGVQNLGEVDENDKDNDVLMTADNEVNGELRTKRHFSLPTAELEDIAQLQLQSKRSSAPSLLSNLEYFPNYPTVYSNILADIPYVELMDSQVKGEKSFFVYHVYISISFHSSNSRTGLLETLPQSEKWLVQRRFSELFAYYKSIKYMLPPVLKQAFPKPGVWSKVHSLSSNELDQRRGQLEIFLNGLLSWWLEIWTAKNGGNAQLSKEIIARELPVVSPLYELIEGQFVCTKVEAAAQEESDSIDQ